MSEVKLDQRQLEGLLEVGRGLVSQLELEVVLERVLEAARDLTGARYAALGVLDHEKRALERFVFVGIDREMQTRIGSLPTGHGLLGELIRNPAPLRLAEISSHPRSYGFPVNHPAMHTFVGVPVMIRGEVYGNLYLTEKTGGEEFDEGDEQALIVLAEWAAIAIDNARMHEGGEERRIELERAVRGLQATASLSRELGGESDFARVLELIAKRGRALVEARACIVLMLDGKQLVVAEAAGEVPADIAERSIAAEGTPPADVLRAGVGQRLEGRSAALPELGLAPEAVLLMPLQARGERIGVLVAVDHFGSEPRFSADSELLLSSFASSAASAIAATRAIADEQRQLSILASERERRRWARELHDETLQELGALKLINDNAVSREDPELMRQALEQASGQVERVISGLQGLITELRPAALDELGTEAAVAALVDRMRSRSELEIDVDIDLAREPGGEPVRHSPELEATMYRIVQEALNNVIKHADASRVRIGISETGGNVTVTVEDDGTGVGEQNSGGFGLIGMRERVELAHGELAIEPASLGGTRVSARLPATRREPG